MTLCRLGLLQCISTHSVLCGTILIDVHGRWLVGWSLVGHEGEAPKTPLVHIHGCNYRTAGPILIKLCTFTEDPNGCLQAGLGSRDQMLGKGAKPPIFGPP